MLPYAIYWSVSWVWETTLSAFLLSLLFVLTLEMEGDDRLSRWFAYGLLWGIAALTNTSMLAWLPFSGCWLAYQLYGCGKRFLVPAALGAAVLWMTLMPWLARNYVVFGKVIFVRGDLGAELRIGNNPEAEGWWVRAYHPGNDPIVYEQYRQMGEAAFDTKQRHLAEEWIVQDPARFLVLSFRRLLFFWAGLPREGLKQLGNVLFAASSLLAIGGLLLAVKKRVHGVFLFATLLAFYPLIYYLTFPTPRYRHAIDPELEILAVFLISQLARMPRRSAASSAVAASVSPPEKTTLVGHLLRCSALAALVFVLVLALALFNNNFALTHPSRAEFNAQLDASLDRSYNWIAAHPVVVGTTPPLMYMLADMEEMTGDPRLQKALAANKVALDRMFPPRPLDPFWYRFVDPHAPLPFMSAEALRGQGYDLQWMAFAIDQKRVPLSTEVRDSLFSRYKYVWGARHHQQVGLIVYRLSDNVGVVKSVDRHPL